MYYPKHQIKKLIGDKVPQLQDTVGNTIKPFQVIQTGDGNFFEFSQQLLDTGNFLNAVRLLKPQDEPKIPNETVLLEKDIDYSKDSIERYFLYNRSNGKIKELSRKQYIDKVKDNRKYETLEKVQWKIQGPVDDIYIKGVLYQGARSQNRKAIEQIKQTIPSIENKVKDYAQFVRDVEIDGIKQQDYKNNTDQFYIPGPSKKL